MLIPVLSKPIWEVKSEMLKVEELNVYYDKIHAVKGVSFEVRDGEICTLIGANGAGKSRPAAPQKRKDQL